MLMEAPMVTQTISLPITIRPRKVKPTTHTPITPPTPRLIPRPAVMARTTPSGSQLPASWNEHMDRLICHCEALGNIEKPAVVKALKLKFPAELAHLDLNHEALQRRINCLELMDNDYFVAGSESAVKRSEEAGFPMPPMDLEQYARKEEAIGRFSEDDSEHEVYRDEGKGVRMVDDEDDDITVGKAITSDDKEEGMGVSNMMKENFSHGSNIGKSAKGMSRSETAGTFGYEYETETTKSANSPLRGPTFGTAINNTLPRPTLKSPTSGNLGRMIASSPTYGSISPRSPGTDRGMARDAFYRPTSPRSPNANRGIGRDASYGSVSPTPGGTPRGMVGDSRYASVSPTSAGISRGLFHDARYGPNSPPSGGTLRGMARDASYGSVSPPSAGTTGFRKEGASKMTPRGPTNN